MIIPNLNLRSSALFLIMVTCTPCSGQTQLLCSPSTQLEAGGAYTCGGFIPDPSGEEAFLRIQDFHIPYSTGDITYNPSGAIRTVLVNVHVWGNGNPNDQHLFVQDNEDALQDVFDRINQEYFANSSLPSDPPLLFFDEIYNCQDGTNYYECRTDSRIRIQLASVYFHTEPTGWNSACTNGPYLTQLAGQQPSVLDNDRYLNIHLVKGGCCPVPGGGQAGGGATPGIMWDWPVSNQIVTCNQGGPWVGVHENWYTTHWAHEIGHILGLRHVYGSEVCSSSTECVSSSSAQ